MWRGDVICDAAGRLGLITGCFFFHLKEGEKESALSRRLTQFHPFITDKLGTVND